MGLYRDWIFPHVLDFVMSREELHEERALTLAPAAGDVLEIGFGTGLNLPFYPAGVRELSVVEPAELLPRRVQARIAEARFPVAVHRAGGEQLPFDASRFDVVVSTFTLCTIPEPERALAEVLRVLRPGGRLLFVEHGRSPDPEVARRQDRWNGLQQVIGAGCNMNRPIDQLVRQAGLQLEQLEQYVKPKTPRILGEHYRGRAVKPA